MANTEPAENYSKAFGEGVSESCCCDKADQTSGTGCCCGQDCSCSPCKCSGPGCSCRM